MSAEAFRQSIEKPGDRIIVALDNMNWLEADEVLQEVGPAVGMAKANAIAQQQGWDHAVRRIGMRGLRTMADAKYKDVPPTMENHVRETTECRPRFVTVFADNTQEALEAAVKGRDDARDKLSRTYPAQFASVGALLGVTVLTSIDKDQSLRIYGDIPWRKVLRFAETAAEAGLDGVVCSGRELSMIRDHSHLDDLLTVVPGMVPEWAAKPEDQARVMTPGEALQRGADYLVVGRAITQPPAGISRAEAAERIADELKEAL